MFLQKLAADLYQNYGDDISKLTIVFSGKRAGVFFKDALAQVAGKTIWSPQVITISELFQTGAALNQAGDINLVTRLYKAFSEIEGFNQLFDDFYPWGEVLLNDFDEADKYLIDINKLFSYVKDFKEIGDDEFLSEEQIELIRRFWGNFHPIKDNITKNKFLSFWKMLSKVYEKFTKDLIKNSIAYEGLIYKHAIKDISQNDYINNNHFVFAGFNALNKCEKELMTYLCKENKATFYWDYDEYYIKNSVQEAGLFMRENIKQFNKCSKSIVSNSFIENTPNVHLYPANGNISQSKLLPDILKTIPKGNPVKTAIILADESMLVPVLYSIPANYKDINVTMGYPMKNTPVYALLQAVYELNKKTELQEEYYRDDLIALLENPYARVFLGKESEAFDNELRTMIFLPADLFNEHPVEVFFNTSKISFNEFLLSLIETILPLVKDSLLQTYLSEFYTLYSNLLDEIEACEINVSDSLLMSLTEKLCNSASIPFEGMPLSGIQVMGFLESRTLDFENIILLNAGEGTLPLTSSKPSFVPYTLRKAFELPAVEQKDAMYAYYFYRLFHNSKNIHVVYNQVTGDSSKGDVSRFIRQIETESNIKVNLLQSAYRIENPHKNDIVIEKDEQILLELEEYCKSSGRKLSPSAILNYKKCPLKFYFANLKNFREPDVSEENINALIVGNVCHYTLEQLYKPLIKNKIDKNYLKDCIKNKAYLEHVNQYLQEKYSLNPVKLSGLNIINYELILKFIEKFIKADISCKEEVYVQNLEEMINIKFQLDDKNINLYGVFDRIDIRDQKEHIIDYKTGKASNIIKESREDGLNLSSEAFQTLTYTYIYQKKYGKQPIPILYTVLNETGSVINRLNYKYKDINETNINEFVAYIENEMKEILLEIFNPEISFTQTLKLQDCKYCTYKSICNR